MVGIYISVPFCKSKCSYCNFASGVFSRDRMQRYVDKLAQDFAIAEQSALSIGALFENQVDSIYLGGGTPSTLAPEQLPQIFRDLSQHFTNVPDAEITVECAPGTLSDEIIATLVRCGVNRVSLGVQSFVDEEAKAVARLHTRETTLRDLDRLRAAGITNLNLDLIAGLPHQTPESWEYSLDQLIATDVPHASVYILEVDEDSRLGRELIAGGQKYHAHQVPQQDLAADFYERACERLNANGVLQYEISNFARSGFESQHNLKYWQRRPYLGFGLDAHSMLPAVTNPDAIESIRFSSVDDLDAYLSGAPSSSTRVSEYEAMEEEFFLGLRLNRGIRLTDIERRRHHGVPEHMNFALAEVIENGLLKTCGDYLTLTPRGRLLSNEVFEKFIDSSPEVSKVR
jgi:oxygen-independent coproporphyrinogen III oxidase